MSDRKAMDTTPNNKQQATLAEWKAFLAKNGPVEHLDAVFVDMCGKVRGKRLPGADCERIFTSGIQIPKSLYFLDVTGVNEDIYGMGVSDGDPDGQAWPISGTIAPVPWGNGKHAQVFMGMVDEKGAPFWIEPRNVLQGVLDRFKDMGLRPVVAAEFEFYLMDPLLGEGGVPQAPLNPRSGLRETANEVYSMTGLDNYSDLISTITRYASSQNIPSSAATAEFAPGQFEVNLNHEDDVLKAGDHAVMLRHLIQAAASEHGYRASFMAKPFLDQTGSGCHMHVSVLDEEGRNIFDDGSEQGNDTLRHAIGGLQQTMAPSMALLAPNVNAFRRFEANNFVPVNGQWGYNNRSVAFRVPTGSPKARRVEHRVAGADVNPYLLFASVLAGIHHGISQKIDPGAPYANNASETPDPRLPRTVPASLEALRGSDVLRDYLGSRYVDVYTRVKEFEFEKLYETISAKEHQWYL